MYDIMQQLLSDYDRLATLMRYKGYEPPLFSRYADDVLSNLLAHNFDDEMVKLQAEEYVEEIIDRQSIQHKVWTEEKAKKTITKVR
jgi:hypothetical protein